MTEQIIQEGTVLTKLKNIVLFIPSCWWSVWLWFDELTNRGSFAETERDVIYRWIFKALWVSVTALFIFLWIVPFLEG